MANNFYADYPVAGGNGVLSLNGETGNVTITSADDSVTITEPDAHTINLSVLGGPAVTSLGPFGSTPNADGASITSGVLTLQPADGTHPGGVSILAQTFAGNKTFTGQILAEDGTLALPGLSFSAEPSTGWLRVGSGNPQFSVLDTLGIDVLKVGSNIHFGFGTTAGGSGSPFIAVDTLNGPSFFSYGNVSTGTSSATIFQIANGTSSNYTTVENYANSTVSNAQTGSGYLNGGSAVFGNANQTQLVLGSEYSAGFIGFTVGGRTLANEQMRLNLTNLTLNNGNSLVMNGSSSGAISIKTQAGAGTYNFNLPITVGGVGQVLTSQAGGSTAMTWTTPTTGTVTSVGLSVPATSIFGVSGSPVTTSGTLGLTTTGTSGGIPYFSSTSQLATSALLTANQLIVGGGAGAAPLTLAAGSSGNVLTISGGVPTWAPPATSGTVTSVAMTVPTFLSVSGSPVTSSGTLTVSLSGTALPVANGGTDVTSVTVAPTATAFAGWDANKNFSTNNLLNGYTATATAAGTTALTVSSTNQQYFTGSTTQIVTMPAVTGLALGTQYTIVNLSTGSVTVQSSGANTIQVMAQNTQLVLTSIATSGTGTAVWIWTYSSVDPAGLPLTNPMTTGGDIIYGGASGTPTRLANGSSGQVLTSAGSTNAPTWTAPVTNSYWSGAMTGATWHTTSATFANATVTGTNTLSTLFNNNITVSAAASNAPGITFTPASSTAVYMIKAAFTGFNSTNADNSAFRLYDGTSVVATGYMQNSGTVGAPWITLEGIYAPATGSSVTIQVQMACNAGQAFMGFASSITGTNIMEWSLIQIK